MAYVFKLGDFKWISYLLNHIDEATALVDWYNTEFSTAPTRKLKVLSLQKIIPILADIVDDMPLNVMHYGGYAESVADLEIKAGRFGIDWAKLLKILEIILPLIAPFLDEPKE